MDLHRTMIPNSFQLLWIIVLVENAEYDRMFGAIGMAIIYTVKHLASSALSRSLTLRSNNCSCFRTNAWQLSTYPRRRIPVFIPYGIKSSLCVFVC
jgi:hypothetical protein